MPRMRLDLLDQDAAEDVGPGVVGGDADAGRPAAVASGCGRFDRPRRGEEIDAGEARESLGDGEPLGLGERIGTPLAPDERGIAGRSGGLGDRRRAQSAMTAS